MFAVTVYFFIESILDYKNIFPEYKLFDVVMNFSNYKSFVVISLITSLCLFSKNRITWLLINSYLYYFLYFAVFSLNWATILSIDNGFLIVLTSLVSMLMYLHSFKNSESYSVKKDKVLALNIISSIIGFLYLFLIQFSNYNYL